MIESSMQNDDEFLQFCTRDEALIRTQTSNELRVSSNYQPYTELFLLFTHQTIKMATVFEFTNLFIRTHQPNASLQVWASRVSLPPILLNLNNTKFTTKLTQKTYVKIQTRTTCEFNNYFDDSYIGMSKKSVLVGIRG